MAAEGRTSYEIHTLADGRWSVAELRETELLALNVARTLFARPQVDGVRVVKVWRRHDGTTDETVVQETCKRKTNDKDVPAAAITEAYFCQGVDDFYGQDSRATMARVLARYLAKVAVTPTELLHNHRALQKMMSAGSLYMGAVDRVSWLHNHATGEKGGKRRDLLYGFVDQASQQARIVGSDARRPRLAGDALDKLLGKARKVAPAGKTTYWATVSLCEDLLSHRNWLGKLARLAQLTGHEPRDDVLGVVDGIVADLVAIKGAFRDILGFHRNLAQALCAIADLCEGGFDASRSDAREELAVFAPLIAAGRMPQTSRALVRQLETMLATRQPLDRYDPSREANAFRQVANRLRRPDNSVFGGEPVMKALKVRAVALFGPGADIKQSAPLAPDPAVQAAHRAMMLALAAKTKTFEAGAVIFREGDACDHAYMVLSGSVEISQRHKGSRTLLAQLGEDAFFGELALFGQTHRTESAVTLAGCQLQILDKQELAVRQESIDPFCRHWIAYLAKIIADLSQRVVAKKEAAP